MIASVPSSLAVTVSSVDAFNFKNILKPLCFTLRRDIKVIKVDILVQNFGAVYKNDDTNNFLTIDDYERIEKNVLALQL